MALECKRTERPFLIAGTIFKKINAGIEDMFELFFSNFASHIVVPYNHYLTSVDMSEHKNEDKKVVLSGIRATGNLHLVIITVP